MFTRTTIAAGLTALAALLFASAATAQHYGREPWHEGWREPFGDRLAHVLEDDVIDGLRRRPVVTYIVPAYVRPAQGVDLRLEASRYKRQERLGYDTVVCLSSMSPNNMGGYELRWGVYPVGANPLRQDCY